MTQSRFRPIKHLKNCQNLSFVKDKHTYGKKMSRKGRTNVIYKGTFVSKQSLVVYCALMTSSGNPVIPFRKSNFHPQTLPFIAKKNQNAHYRNILFEIENSFGLIKDYYIDGKNTQLIFFQKISTGGGK